MEFHIILKKKNQTKTYSFNKIQFRASFIQLFLYKYLGGAAAIATSVVVDSIITNVDSIISKKYSPYGTFDYLTNFKHASFEDHFDMLAEGASIGEGGSRFSKY